MWVSSFGVLYAFFEFDIDGSYKNFVLQEGDSFVILFLPIMAWSPGQSIGLYKCFSRVVLEDEVEVLYEGMLSCLSSTQVL